MSAIQQVLMAAAGAFVFSPTISANTQNYNLRAAAVSAGWDQVSALNATVTIGGSVVVGSASTGSYAFNTGTTFPAGSTLALVLNSGSYIVGAGGADGAAGGPALNASFALSIANAGTIGGGGGSGGIGAIAVGGVGIGDYRSVSSGGGAGNVVGSSSVQSGDDSGSGTAGTLTTGGTGGTGHGSGYTGTGGSGGSLGSAGGNGVNNYYGANTPVAGGAGGAAVVGNSNITWVSTGTRLGSIT